MNKETYSLLFRSWYQQLPLHIRLTARGLCYSTIVGLLAIGWMFATDVSINISTYFAVGLLFVVWINYCKMLVKSFERDLDKWFQMLTQVSDYSKMSK